MSTNSLIIKKMKQKRRFLLTLAFFGLSVCATLAQTTYIIEQDGSNYHVYKGGSYVNFYSVMQNAIDYIKTDANGAACTISLNHVNGEDPLDLGGGIPDTKITFEGNWGAITLTGNATYSGSGNAGYGIRIATGITLNSKAELTATGARPMIVTSQGGILTISEGIVQRTIGASLGTITNNGTLHITGGIVKATGNVGNAILNYGTLNISGGEVQKTGDGSTIRNYNVNSITTISGGTVSATGASTVAISNRTEGNITISGTATITSENTSATDPGTIYLEDGGTGVGTRLSINGGTVKNTASNGRAICNSSPGAIAISGGTLQTNSGTILTNQSTGTVNITGGVFSTNGYAITNTGGANINISGNASISSTSANPAVSNSSTGKIEILGNASVSTTGGFAVRNTSTGEVSIGGNAKISATSGTAVYNVSTGIINIQGNSLVRATTGYAVRNYDATGKIDLKDQSIIFAQGTGQANVINGDNINRLNNAVIVAWNEAAGIKTYEAGTNNDIFIFPAAATAVWAKQDSDSGISVENGSNTGFIPIAEVTVGNSSIESISHKNGLQVYPNPTSGRFSVFSEQFSENIIEIFDIAGRELLTFKLDKLSTEIDISHLPNGIYFVKVGKETIKVVKR